MRTKLLSCLLFFITFHPYVWPYICLAETYHLDIARKEVNITGKPVKKITVNGTIPGPTLYFKEGQNVTITVTNHLDESTSVHWHGLLLPGEMDGVPGLNGFPGIAPNETFTYHFKIRQSGTYWYHAHSMGQEQEGHYGSIVIAPKGTDPIKSNRDYVVLLSDFSNEESHEILHNLKMDSAYYNYAQRTLGDFFKDVKKKGFRTALSSALDWGSMRMSPTDLSDVSGYTFLMNGQTPEENWTGLFTPGDKIRLRFINASAMSFYDVRIPGLKMKIVQADGQNVEPVIVDEFRFGVAETYDVIIEPKADKAYTIAAESIDRTGFALGTVAPRAGMRGEMPIKRERTLLTMTDMGMSHDMGSMPDGGHSMHEMKEMPGMDHSRHGGQMMNHSSADTSGWAKAGTPPGHKALDYSDLRYLGTQSNTLPPDRDITVRLGGNMERYIWTLNGKKYEEAGPIKTKYGEKVRIKLINDTMMAHPMHLHGMFVQLENGQADNKLPNKHTVIIPPGQSYSVLLVVNEPGEWAFHCHLLYHMLSGMMTTVTVSKLDYAIPPQEISLDKGESHAH